MKKWKPKKAQEGIKFAPINIKDYRYDQEGNIVNNKTGETGTLAIPEVTANSPSSYRTSFDGGFDLLRNISQGVSAIKNKINRTVQGTDPLFYMRDLSKEYVDRITPETQDASSILTNEFVEDNPNNIRYAEDFRNTTDTLIGDKKIPLSKISQFYGAKDGKLIVGNLSTFNDDDVPVRNKNIGRVKKILIDPISQNYRDYYEDKLKQIDKKRRDSRYNIYSSYARKHNITPTVSDYLSFVGGATPLASAGRRAYLKKYHQYPATKYDNEYWNTYDRLQKPLRFITENNDTITAPGESKLILGDEYGNSYFIDNLQRINKKDLNTLNKNIQKHPVLVDKGRYSKFYKSINPTQNYNTYIRQDFYRDPQSLYILGTRNIKK